jgi:hypothetical protein
MVIRCREGFRVIDAGILVGVVTTVQAALELLGR